MTRAAARMTVSVERSKGEEMDGPVPGGRRVPGPGMEGDVLGLHGGANADSEGETSGMDRSLFEEIGGDIGGLAGVHRSVYDNVGTVSAGPGFDNFSLRFQTDDVPFIRAARNDLDGPLDGPLFSLQRKAGGAADIPGAGLGPTLENHMGQHTAGPPGGLPAGDGNGAENQDSPPLISEDFAIECRRGIGSMTRQGKDANGVSGTSVAGNMTLDGFLLEEGGSSLGAGRSVDGAPSLAAIFPEEAPRKRVRASRELGSLLVDARGIRSRTKAAGLQEAVSDTFAEAVVRGTTEASAAVEGSNLDSTEFVVARVEARVTRSRALGGHAGGAGESLAGSSRDGSPDVSARKTGKRSAARGGRLGWGNAQESHGDGTVRAGEFPILPVPGEAHVGTPLDADEIREDSQRGRGSWRGSRAGGRAKKARGKTKQMGNDGEGGQLGSTSPHLTDLQTETFINDTTHDVNPCESQGQIEDVVELIPPVLESKQVDPAQKVASQETDTLQSVTVLHAHSGGRRRSNRHKANAGLQPEQELMLGHDHRGQSNKKQRRRGPASTKKSLPEVAPEDVQIFQERSRVEEVLDHPKPSTLGESELVSADGNAGEALQERNEELQEPAVGAIVGSNTPESGSREGMEAVRQLGTPLALGNAPEVPKEEMLVLPLEEIEGSNATASGSQERKEDAQQSEKPLALEGRFCGGLPDGQCNVKMEPTVTSVLESKPAHGPHEESKVAVQRMELTHQQQMGKESYANNPNRASPQTVSVFEQGRTFAKPTAGFEEKVFPVRSEGDALFPSVLTQESAGGCLAGVVQAPLNMNFLIGTLHSRRFANLEPGASFTSLLGKVSAVECLPERRVAELTKMNIIPGTLETRRTQDCQAGAKRPSLLGKECPVERLTQRGAEELRNMNNNSGTLQTGGCQELEAGANCAKILDKESAVRGREEVFNMNHIPGTLQTGRSRDLEADADCTKVQDEGSAERGGEELTRMDNIPGTLQTGRSREVEAGANCTTVQDEGSAERGEEELTSMGNISGTLQTARSREVEAGANSTKVEDEGSAERGGEELTSLDNIPGTLQTGASREVEAGANSTKVEDEGSAERGGEELTSLDNIPGTLQTETSREVEAGANSTKVEDEGSAERGGEELKSMDNTPGTLQTGTSREVEAGANSSKVQDEGSAERGGEELPSLDNLPGTLQTGISGEVEAAANSTKVHDEGSAERGGEELTSLDNIPGTLQTERSREVEAGANSTKVEDEGSAERGGEELKSMDNTPGTLQTGTSREVEAAANSSKVQDEGSAERGGEELPSLDNLPGTLQTGISREVEAAANSTKVHDEGSAERGGEELTSLDNIPGTLETGTSREVEDRANSTKVHDEGSAERGGEELTSMDNIPGTLQTGRSRELEAGANCPEVHDKESAAECLPEGGVEEIRNMIIVPETLETRVPQDSEAGASSPSLPDKEPAVLCLTEGKVEDLASIDNFSGTLQRQRAEDVLTAELSGASTKLAVESGDSVSLEKDGDNAIVDSETKGSSDGEVIKVDGVTNLHEIFHVISKVDGVDGDDAGSATANDSTASKEDVGQPQGATGLSFVTTVPSGKDEEMLDVAATEGIANVEAGVIKRGQPEESNFGFVPSVDSTLSSEAGADGKVGNKKGGGKKSGGKKSGGKKGGEQAGGTKRGGKKNDAIGGGQPTAVEEQKVSKNRKPVVVGTKGKQKLDVATAVRVVKPKRQRSVKEGRGIDKDTGGVVVKGPVSSGKGGSEESKKDGKKRQKGDSAGMRVDLGLPTKKRKVGTLLEPPLRADPRDADMIVTGNCKAPAEQNPSSGGIKLMRGQLNKRERKKSEKAPTGKKVGRSSPVDATSKRRTRPARGTGVPKAATIKELSSIKDQANKEGLPRPKERSVRPKDAKGPPKLSDKLHRRSGGDARANGVKQEDVTGKACAWNRVASESRALICVNTDAGNEGQGVDAGTNFDGGAVGEDVSSGVTEGGENKGSEKGSDSAGAHAEAPRKSWVLCDDCNKWRCIPVELAEQIGSTNAKWSCRDNPDKEFQDCAIPQEKSNAEINAELQISDVSVCEEGDDKDAVDSKSMTMALLNEGKPAVWKRVHRNIFQHRRRKVLEIDEMMVCQCTTPEDGGVGCGDNCLNRLLSIECVAGQCPCGEACSNQQFQKRTYAPVEIHRCGRKGFGLKVLERISKGSFIIEYVGEVLDVNAFAARQKEYEKNGQKHFYFMTLNTNEVIDACSKGNFGRFINHSCEPNCRTEKWMVNGEVCIGLFAVRDIGKDEEVTFDYNFVRWYGSAAKKCECGSSRCRGFIGGDPVTPKAVVESESEEEEDLEPIMVENSEEEDADVDESKPATCKMIEADAQYQHTSTVLTSGVKRKPPSVKEKAPLTVKRLKTGSVRKSSFLNSRGLTVDVGAGKHDGARTISFSDEVRDKLDEMLDKNGGLRKRKDAAKQYLSLLVQTSATGDDRKHAAACSMRDQSLLLEALLKTTSRTVLSDIMNKNGLRMIHNLIKQLRRQWDKTPILRKLIKVLELLASERMLTMDLMDSSPPCSGMESFSESLFELTRHQDSEVVIMARRFRNKWMPPRPHLHDQHYKGSEKPYSTQTIQSSSPVVTHQGDQFNGHRFQSPQELKRASCTPPLNGTELSRPKSSEIPHAHGGAVLGSGSQNGQSGWQNGTIVKGDENGGAKTLVPGEDSNREAPQQATKNTRRRPSRWDALPTAENSSLSASCLQVDATQSDTLVRGSCIPRDQTQAVNAGSSKPGLAQVQLEDTKQFVAKSRSLSPKVCNPDAPVPSHHEAPVNSRVSRPASEALSASMHVHRQATGSSGSQQRWPAASNGLQDSGRLSNGRTAAQPQIQVGTPAVAQQAIAPVPAHLPTQRVQGNVPIAHLPGSPAMQVQRTPPLRPAGPPHSGGRQQMPFSNVMPLGGPPVPGQAYALCAPYQMAGGAVTPPQMPVGAVPFARGYTAGPFQMPPGAPYVQWVPPAGASHFAVPPSVSVDPSQRQSMPTGPSNKKGDDVISQEDVIGKGRKDSNILGSVDPEPPVPGLSPPPPPPLPPPPPPPPPGQVPMMMVSNPGPDSHALGMIMETIPARPGFHDWQVVPPYMQNRDQQFGYELNVPRDPDSRDKTGAYHSGECWESPEGEGFRQDVFALVTRRVQKFHKLRTRDLDRFCSKMADVIVRKEVAKYIEQRSQGIEKIIVKSKLMDKVDSYVDNQVGMYLQKIGRSQRG